MTLALWPPWALPLGLGLVLLADVAGPGSGQGVGAGYPTAMGALGRERQ